MTVTAHVVKRLAFVASNDSYDEVDLYEVDWLIKWSIQEYAVWCGLVIQQIEGNESFTVCTAVLSALTNRLVFTFGNLLSRSARFHS